MHLAHLVSNPRPSDFYHSAWTAALPRVQYVHIYDYVLKQIIEINCMWLNGEFVFIIVKKDQEINCYLS
jgi:hypothetical protein